MSPVDILITDTEEWLEGSNTCNHSLLGEKQQDGSESLSSGIVLFDIKEITMTIDTRAYYFFYN